LAERTKEQRLFGAACLKLMMEARGGGPSEIYEQTLKDLDLTEDEVDVYLSEHRDVVQAALEAHGQPRN
jgi:hypothetical protein